MPLTIPVLVLGTGRSLMHSGLHAVGIGFQRLGVVAGVVVLGAALSYILLVFALVVVQAVGAFGQ